MWLGTEACRHGWIYMHVCMGGYICMCAWWVNMYPWGVGAYICMWGVHMHMCVWVGTHAYVGVILTNVLSGWEELSLSLSENMYSLPFNKVRRQGNEHILMKFIDRQQLLVYIFNAATSNTNKSDNHKICFLVLVL